MWFSKGALQLWQKELGNRSFVATILMDLSKIYDSIPHELVIAKLECCGLDRTSLGLMLDYLSNCKQSTKIGWNLAHGMKLVYSKVQFLELFFSICLSMIYSFLLQNQRFLILQMITHYTVATKI